MHMLPNHCSALAVAFVVAGGRAGAKAFLSSAVSDHSETDGISSACMCLVSGVVCVCVSVCG